MVISRKGCVLERLVEKKFSGSHAPAWEPIRDAGASGLHSHAGAWEREKGLDSKTSKSEGLDSKTSKSKGLDSKALRYGSDAPLLE